MKEKPFFQKQRFKVVWNALRLNEAVSLCPSFCGSWSWQKMTTEGQQTLGTDAGSAAAEAPGWFLLLSSHPHTLELSTCDLGPSVSRSRRGGQKVRGFLCEWKAEVQQFTSERTQYFYSLKAFIVIFSLFFSAASTRVWEGRQHAAMFGTQTCCVSLCRALLCCNRSP